MTVKEIIPTHYEFETGDDKPTGVRLPVTTLRDILTNMMWITYDGGANWIPADKRMRLTSERGDFVSRPQYRVPYLRSANNGSAEWSREQARYGQWTAKLIGGVQSAYDDHASVSWNEDKPFLKDLNEILYVYRMSAEEVAAPNIAIHVHDPDHPERRADISLSHTHDDLGKTVGWHEFSLVDAVYGLFYYGNNIPGTTELVAHGVASDLYTLAQFKADPVFSTYVISRITIEWGYYSAGTFDAVHIAKVEVNGTDIPLGPSTEETLKEFCYEFSINGINFNGHANIKMLTLDGNAKDDVPLTLHDAGVDYFVPTGKVFISFQALIYLEQSTVIGRIGEGGTSSANQAIDKEVLKFSNGTNLPFMTPCYGVFTAGHYINAETNSTNSSYEMVSGSVLYGVELDA